MAADASFVRKPRVVILGGKLTNRNYTYSVAGFLTLCCDLLSSCFVCVIVVSLSAVLF